jgi:PAS domain S-box-containing protein
MAAIVESSDDAIISKDLSGIITSWNDAAERIFGYTAAEIVGRPVTVLIPPELLAEENFVLSKIRAGERVAHFETVRVGKNGERIDVSLTVSPVKDNFGIVVGAAKILRDITDQKRANDSRNKLAAIFDSSEDAIVSKNLNGIVTAWNKSAGRLFGYKAAEFIGQPITLLIPPEFMNDENEILAKLRPAKELTTFRRCGSPRMEIESMFPSRFHP